MTNEERFTAWYESLPLEKTNSPHAGQSPPLLVVLEHLKEDFDLKLDSTEAKGQGQIRGVSGTATAKILVAFGRLGTS